MNKKEIEIHQTVDMSLTNLLDKIDLSIHHIQKSNENYDQHISDLYQCKNKIKKILNADFDRCALNKK